MRLIALCLFGGSLYVVTASAQSPAALKPTFEVASVKMHDGDSAPAASRLGRGSMTFTNYPMRLIIASAYGLRPNRVVGGPKWIDAEGVTVVAKAPDGTPDNQLPLMLRSLLAERAKLSVRFETREQPIYALVLARADRRLGPNLRRSIGGLNENAARPARAPIPAWVNGQQVPCGVRSSFEKEGAAIQGGDRTIADLARTLQGSTGRDVIDRTGLMDTYDFDLRFVPGGPQALGGDSAEPSVFTALQEQLGLKLEPQNGSADYLVIDSIERPTPD